MIGAAVVIVVARDSIVETERRKAERLNIKLVLRKKVNYRERSEIVCRIAGHEVADWDIARLRCIKFDRHSIVFARRNCSL
jgi:hypothetical protein